MTLTRVRGALAVAQVVALLFNFVCLVATPPGFDLDVCLLLWALNVGIVVVALEGMGPPPVRTEVALCMYVTVGLAHFLAFLALFKGPGAAIVCCFLYNTTVFAGACVLRHLTACR